jgi:hypothetical protein
MFQKCPNCINGRDIVGNICTVCKGKKIIDTVTGLPPQEPIREYKNIDCGDFRDRGETQQEYFGKR